MAVDLGTTHIRLSLWDKRGGKRLSGRSGINPQLALGTDVMSRLVAAFDAQGNAHLLAPVSARRGGGGHQGNGR